MERDPNSRWPSLLFCGGSIDSWAWVGLYDSQPLNFSNNKLVKQIAAYRLPFLVPFLFDNQLCIIDCEARLVHSLLQHIYECAQVCCN